MAEYEVPKSWCQRATELLRELPVAPTQLRRVRPLPRRRVECDLDRRAAEAVTDYDRLIDFLEEGQAERSSVQFQEILGPPAESGRHLAQRSHDQQRS